MDHLKNIKLNKNVINKVVEKFGEDLSNLQNSLTVNNNNNCYYNNNDMIFRGLNKTFFEDILKNLKTEYDLISLLNFNLNKKIKYNPNNNIKIIGFNTKPYILCDNMINGTCPISSKCYASKQEYSKKNNMYYSLLNSLRNYVFFYYCIYSENTNRYLNLALFKNLSVLKKFNVIRYNIKSDIIDNNHLQFLNKMFIILKKQYKYEYAYTYTKTKNLDFNIDEKFIINRSIIIDNIIDLEKFNKTQLKKCFITVTDKNLQIKGIDAFPCKYYINHTNCNICLQCLTKKNKYTYIH